MSIKNIELKKRSIENRIRRLEAGIKLANQYLETGEHADWAGFRPLFWYKWKGDEICPPHKDWVKNVVIKRLEREITKANKALKRLEH